MRDGEGNARALVLVPSFYLLIAAEHKETAEIKKYVISELRAHSSAISETKL
jgi:hypothetical protein